MAKLTKKQKAHDGKIERRSITASTRRSAW
jgi:hypothetical protein